MPNIYFKTYPKPKISWNHKVRLLHRLCWVGEEGTCRLEMAQTSESKRSTLVHTQRPHKVLVHTMLSSVQDFARLSSLGSCSYKQTEEEHNSRSTCQATLYLHCWLCRWTKPENCLSSQIMSQIMMEIHDPCIVTNIGRQSISACYLSLPILSVCLNMYF